MRDEDKQALFRMILQELAIRPRRDVWELVYAAHMGRPWGVFAHSDHVGLARIYRNHVNPSPDHLIDAALAYGKPAEAAP